MGHSASPAMHNAALAHLGLDWRYLAFDVHPDSLRQALEGARAMKFIGVNLTVPHKLLALECVGHLDESARTWGAVNTVLFEGKIDPGEEVPWQPLRCLDPGRVGAVRTRGFNTDADAIIQSIEEDLGVVLRNLSVLLLGAGGAGRTAALRLAAEGVRELHLVNRTAEKAASIAAEIARRYPAVRVATGYPGGAVDLVVNATSLGLKPDDPLPFDARQFSLKQCGAAYDMIYRPAETPFLAEAARAARPVANGLGMLLYQGAKALEIWSGRPAPVPVMRAALRDHVYGP